MDINKSNEPKPVKMKIGTGPKKPKEEPKKVAKTSLMDDLDDLDGL